MAAVMGARCSAGRIPILEKMSYDTSSGSTSRRTPTAHTGVPAWRTACSESTTGVAFGCRARDEDANSYAVPRVARSTVLERHLHGQHEQGPGCALLDVTNA